MSKWCIGITWDDCPHLTPDDVAELWDSIPPHQRDARAKGIPALGSGVIYPVAEGLILVDDFDIPAHWPKAYGLDVGWNRTAATWGAWDQSSDTVYLYSEHYVGEAVPQVHADSIKARGEWIPGAIDPAANGRQQGDGKALMEQYRGLGLDLINADNTVEAGLFAIYRRMVSGRFKIFKSCTNTVSELRLYRRDEKGKIVKERDHAMDAMRYLVMTGLSRACCEPALTFNHEQDYNRRNSVTGY